MLGFVFGFLYGLADGLLKARAQRRAPAGPAARRHRPVLAGPIG